MDKKLVQDIFRNKVRVGDCVEIVSITPLECLTGNFTVLSTKIGRGKGGGAQVVELKNNTTNEILKTVSCPDKVREIGTGISDYLLKIKHNGVSYGADTAEEAARVEGKPNEELSQTLLTLFESFQPGKKLKVTMTTQNNPVNGTWNVVEVKSCVGRRRQKKVILTSPNQSSTVELWSFRDSGKIENIEEC